MELFRSDMPNYGGCLKETGVFFYINNVENTNKLIYNIIYKHPVRTAQ